MAGEIKVYSLGDKGVNVSNDSRHADIGEVVSAQNASFLSSGKRGGLSKRLGMVAINSVALAGAILSLASVTFTDPTPGAILTDTAGYILTDDSSLILSE